jgi:hypothetical protein
MVRGMKKTPIAPWPSMESAAKAMLALSHV